MYLRIRLITLLVFAAMSSSPAVAQVLSGSELFELMSERVALQNETLVDFRHDLHQHPEISGAEQRTAGLIADYLIELGFEVRSGVGGHGVVAVLKGALPGPMVGFRADMDAVRSNTYDPVEFRSLSPGVRHICGHDVHTTIGIGLAEGFAAAREHLAGSVMLIFQPAEERGTGAKAMLADGAFSDVVPDAVFAVHTAPYEVGQVATVSGGMMAGRASFTVRISGDGDLEAAAQIVRNAISEVGNHSPQLAGQVAPEGFIMVRVFPSRRSGLAVVVTGQIMTAGRRDRDLAKTGASAVMDALQLDDVDLVLDYDERFMEGVTNDHELVELANEGITTYLPEMDIQTVRGAVPMFSEDFGSFQALAPGVMYFLGVSNAEKGTVGMPHSPDYVADDASILAGTRAMLAAMLARMLAN